MTLAHLSIEGNMLRQIAERLRLSKRHGIACVCGDCRQVERDAEDCERIAVSLCDDEHVRSAR